MQPVVQAFVQLVVYSVNAYNGVNATTRSTDRRLSGSAEQIAEKAVNSVVYNTWQVGVHRLAVVARVECLVDGILRHDETVGLPLVPARSTRCTVQSNSFRFCYFFTSRRQCFGAA